MHSFKSFLKEQSKNENIGNVIGAIGKAAGPIVKKIGDHIGRNKLPYAKFGGAGAAAYGAKKFYDTHKDTIKKVAIGGAGAYAAKKTYDAVKNRKTGGGSYHPKGQEKERQMQKQYGNNNT